MIEFNYNANMIKLLKKQSNIFKVNYYYFSQILFKLIENKNTYHNYNNFYSCESNDD